MLPAVDPHHPGVVLMDIRMPRLDGVAATRPWRALHGPPPVIGAVGFVLLSGEAAGVHAHEHASSVAGLLVGAARDRRCGLSLVNASARAA